MKFKKNDKGFSLVELIIVIAIMVALVAVLAPQFTKYVQNSRDAIVQSSAEDVLTVAKSEFALGNLTATPDDEGAITGTIVITPNDSHVLTVTHTGLVYHSSATAEKDTFDTDFVNLCGIDTQKTVNSTKSYTITVGGTLNNPTFSLAETTK